MKKPEVVLASPTNLMFNKRLHVCYVAYVLWTHACTHDNRGHNCLKGRDKCHDFGDHSTERTSVAMWSGCQHRKRRDGYSTGLTKRGPDDPNPYREGASPIAEGAVFTSQCRDGVATRPTSCSWHTGWHREEGCSRTEVWLANVPLEHSKLIVRTPVCHITLQQTPNGFGTLPREILAAIPYRQVFGKFWAEGCAGELRPSGSLIQSILFCFEKYSLTPTITCMIPISQLHMALGTPIGGSTPPMMHH